MRRTHRCASSPGLIKKGAAELAEQDQGYVPEVKVLPVLGMFAVPVAAETTIGEICRNADDREREYETTFVGDQRQQTIDVKRPATAGESAAGTHMT